MAATSTLRQILMELAERESLGLVIREIDPDAVTTTTVTLPNSVLQGQMSGAQIPVNRVIQFVSPADNGVATASSATTLTDSTKAWVVNEWTNFVVKMGGWYAVVTSNTSTVLTFTTTLDEAPTVGPYLIELGASRISNYNASTGALTMAPALGSTAATAVHPHTAIIWEKEIRNAQIPIDAVNRALQNRIGRWELRPLTFVPDGDMQGTTIADYWTAAASGVIAYANAQVYPAGGAVDAQGQVGLNRFVQLTSTGATSVTGNGIRSQLSNQLRPWYFRTAIRLVSGTGTAEFKVRDNTNAADISLQVMRGNDSNTLTMTTFGDWLVCEGTFQLPATCAEIAPQLTVSATGMVAQLGPVTMFPMGAYSFPLPNRIESENLVGDFFQSWTTKGPGGFPTLSIDPNPYTLDGRTHHITDYGDHMTVTFNCSIHRPLFYEEWVNGPALVGMTDTTTFPLDWVVSRANAILQDRLMKDDLGRAAELDNGTPKPSVRQRLRNAAIRSADNSVFEPRMKQVAGRR